MLTWCSEANFDLPASKGSEEVRQNVLRHKLVPAL